MCNNNKRTKQKRTHRWWHDNRNVSWITFERRSNTLICISNIIRSSFNCIITAPLFRLSNNIPWNDNILCKRRKKSLHCEKCDKRHSAHHTITIMTLDLNKNSEFICDFDLPPDETIKPSIIALLSWFEWNHDALRKPERCKRRNAKLNNCKSK